MRLRSQKQSRRSGAMDVRVDCLLVGSNVRLIKKTVVNLKQPFDITGVMKNFLKIGIKGSKEDEKLSQGNT